MTRKRSNAFSINSDAPLDSEQQLLLECITGPNNPPPAPVIRAITPLAMFIAFRNKSNSTDKNETPPVSPSGCKSDKKHKFDDHDKDNDGLSPTKPTPQPPPFML